MVFDPSLSGLRDWLIYTSAHFDEMLSRGSTPAGSISANKAADVPPPTSVSNNFRGDASVASAQTIRTAVSGAGVVGGRGGGGVPVSPSRPPAPATAESEGEAVTILQVEEEVGFR
jgi:hypothetical protein